MHAVKLRNLWVCACSQIEKSVASCPIGNSVPDAMLFSVGCTAWCNLNEIMMNRIQTGFKQDDVGFKQEQQELQDLNRTAEFEQVLQESRLTSRIYRNGRNGRNGKKCKNCTIGKCGKIGSIFKRCSNGHTCKIGKAWYTGNNCKV